MAMVLDELVLALGIDDKNFSAGEQAVVAGLDRLTAVMENVAQAFDTGEKKSSEALDKTGKKADKTAKGMEASGKKAASFFSSIRAQVLALAGVTLSLGGLKSFVTGFTSNLNQLIDRQHPGQRPHADSAHEDQPPDRHVDTAQHVQQAAHQHGDRPQQRRRHHVARGEERQRQRDQRRGDGAGEHDGDGDADLLEVVHERPVDEVVPDEHAQEIAPQLLAAVDKLRPGNAEDQEEEHVVQHDRQRDQADGAQVAPLLREDRSTVSITPAATRLRSARLALALSMQSRAASSVTPSGCSLTSIIRWICSGEKREPLLCLFNMPNSLTKLRANALKSLMFTIDIPD